MITMQQVGQYGKDEAVALAANHNGWAVATPDAMNAIFGAGAAEAGYQSLTIEGAVINVCTQTMGHPPQAFAP